MLRGDILQSKESNKLVNKQTKIYDYILKLQSKASVFIAQKFPDNIKMFISVPEGANEAPYRNISWCVL